MTTKRKTIFPISYYQGQLEDNEKLKQELLPYIDVTKTDIEIAIAESVAELFEDNNNFVPKYPITSYGMDDINQVLYQNNELQKQYHNLIKSFCGDKYNLVVSQLWYNYFHKSEYHALHDHVPDPLDSKCHFACVHYLCYDKKVHKPLFFNDPIDRLRSHSIEFDSHDYESDFYPDINEGDLIMFPSYLLHGVEENKPTPNNPRITISFNLELTINT